MDTLTAQDSIVGRRLDEALPQQTGRDDDSGLRGAWPSESARLLTAARQALSVPRLRVAVVLRLSCLQPPLPRPHHRRIAGTVFEESARLYRGETFDLPSGDMVLLCHAPPADGCELHPTALPQVLARLFRADVPARTALTTIWNLEREGAALLAYTAALGE